MSDEQLLREIEAFLIALKRDRDRLVMGINAIADDLDDTEEEIHLPWVAERLRALVGPWPREVPGD